MLTLMNYKLNPGAIMERQSKMEAHKRLFYSDPTAYYGQESVLESQGLGTRKPRLQAKQTSVYTKHLKSSIGSW